MFITPSVHPLRWGQGNSAIVSANSQAIANNACVPTATADGLAYLEAYQQSLSKPFPFSSTPNSYPTVNTLITDMGTTASGTTTTGQLNGLYSYLSTTAPAVSLSGQVAPAEKNNLPGFYGSASLNAGFSASIQSANPTAQYLYNALNANDSVQLGLLWGSYSSGTFMYTGGHEVSLEGLSLSGGTGSMTVVDPWGAANGALGNNAASSGTVGLSLSVSTVNVTGLGSFLMVTFGDTTQISSDTTEDDPAQNLDGSGTPGDGFGTPQPITALVVDDVVESVPEPSITGLAVVGALAFLAKARRK